MKRVRCKIRGKAVRTYKSLPGKVKSFFVNEAVKKWAWKKNKVLSTIANLEKKPQKDIAVYLDEEALEKLQQYPRYMMGTVISACLVLEIPEPEVEETEEDWDDDGEELVIRI